MDNISEKNETNRFYRIFRKVIHRQNDDTCADYVCLDSLNPTKGSKFEKAVKYAQNHRDSLHIYLQDGRCELFNNAAERKAKSYAIGRKNSLFHTSVDGAKASSIIYSLVETAKANNLNGFSISIWYCCTCRAVKVGSKV